MIVPANLQWPWTVDIVLQFNATAIEIMQCALFSKQKPRVSTFSVICISGFLKSRFVNEGRCLLSSVTQSTWIYIRKTVTSFIVTRTVLNVLLVSCATISDLIVPRH